MVTTVIPVEPFDLVIFGGTGDLARRKLLPALYQRWRAGQMPGNARVICVGRQPLTDESYRNRVETSFREFAVPCVDDQEALGAFLTGVSYARVDVNGSDGWSELRRMLRRGRRSGVLPVCCSVIVRRDYGDGHRMETCLP